MFSPDFADKQTGAFVTRLDAGGATDGLKVYPGGAEVAQETGARSLALASGRLFVSGTFSGPIDVDGYPVNLGGFGNNPFLAELDPGPLATKWFHSFEGGGESFVSKSFFVASQGGSPIVAGSWRTTITLPTGEQLPTKGDGTDTDIIAAKFGP